MKDRYFVIDEEDDATGYDTLEVARLAAQGKASDGEEAIVCKAITKFIPVAKEVPMESEAPQ